MNNNNLKRFAKEARIKLLDQVGRKLEFILSADTAELRGKQKEIAQLKEKIALQGKEQVIETVAYTWFNRLMALRFMDANGYTIPKVVTPLPGMTNPEILQSALAGNVEPELKLDRQRLNDLLDRKTAATDAHTEAYKMLLVASCNQWHTAMPFMFERISDYTELLLPDDLLSDYSIVADIRNGMSDEDCQQEELIGWLYQFYIADKKDDVFDGLKKNIKITAENIPAATQLFTPRWIVRYMVENTLGKLWFTLKPNSKLRQHMPYFIEAPEGNDPAPLPEGIKGVTDITFLDPCQGSGHVLVYAFDLFTKIYEEEGYNTNEIPALILEHNLFGIDIDERAAQLAAFALTMKARSYYTRFLRKPVQPHVIALENVNEDIIKQAVKLPLQVAGKLVYDYRDLTLYNLTQADNFGSLIQIDPEELKALSIQKGSIWQEQEQKLKEQAEYLSRQYHCVVTNPPYMGRKGMNSGLKHFVESMYEKSDSDLMACFMERCLSFNVASGKMGMINQHSWMFLNSYEGLRPFLIDNFQFESLLHLGPHTFPEIGGEMVQNTAFVFGKYLPKMKGVFIRLADFGDPELKEIKTREAVLNKSCGWLFIKNQTEFEKLPSDTIAFWLSEEYIKIFSTGIPLGKISEPRRAIQTGDSERFIRRWYEVNFSDIEFNAKSESIREQSVLKWYLLSNGGSARKWFGNIDYVINWKHNGGEIKSTGKAILPNEQLYFKECAAWNRIASKALAFKYITPGLLCGEQNPFLFAIDDLKYLMAILNSSISTDLLQSINPTLAAQSGSISQIPIIQASVDRKVRVISYVDKLINLYKDEWNASDLSSWFDFLQFTKLKDKATLESHFQDLLTSYQNRIEEAKHISNEIENEVIAIYQLKSSANYSEDFKYLYKDLITKEDFLRFLLQLSAGFLFGRYSLNKNGIILGSQSETFQDFLKKVPDSCFIPDEDNIIPVLDGEWFTDDIVGRFKVFLKAAFGEEHFEENLKYIKDTIGKDVRKYFVKDFYNDHIKRYKKRPIYWMFSSPKGHFKALIYMHRYQPDLCSKMLNDYLQAFISKLEAAKQTQTMLSLREDILAREKTSATKEIDKLELMLKDCRDYAKTLFSVATQKISIDLDDGVKLNYQKFKEVLVPIKGLEKEED